MPKLVVEGVTCDDLNEGELGNTWFVSACVGLAREQKLFNKVSLHYYYKKNFNFFYCYFHNVNPKGVIFCKL